MSMYEALGGESLVRETVEIFYAKLQADPVTAVFFEGNDLGGLKTHQRMFLTAAFGGPDAYGGRDMRAAHAHLAITDTDFDRFLGHLRDALADVGTSSVVRSLNVRHMRPGLDRRGPSEALNRSVGSDDDPSANPRG